MRSEASRLEELREAAREDLFDAELALGRHHEVVAGLEGLVTRGPLRERRWGQLMVALYRDGRQADGFGRVAEIHQEQSRPGDRQRRGDEEAEPPVALHQGQPGATQQLGAQVLGSRPFAVHGSLNATPSTRLTRTRLT